MASLEMRLERQYLGHQLANAMEMATKFINDEFADGAIFPKIKYYQQDLGRGFYKIGYTCEAPSGSVCLAYNGKESIGLSVLYDSVTLQHTKWDGHKFGFQYEVEEFKKDYLDMIKLTLELALQKI